MRPGERDCRIAPSIFTFMVARNELLFARLLTSSENMKTLPIGI